MFFANYIRSYINGISYYSNNTYFNVSNTGNEHFRFSTDAYTTFREQGLPAGMAWGLTYGGISYTSTGSAIVASGNASQNIQFNIGRAGNYLPDPSSGSIVAANQNFYDNNGTVNFQVPVEFTPETLSGESGIPVSTLNVSSFSASSGSQLNFSGTDSIDTITSDPSSGLTYVTYAPDFLDQFQSYVAVLNSSDYRPIATLILGSGAVPTYSMLDQAVFLIQGRTTNICILPVHINVECVISQYLVV